MYDAVARHTQAYPLKADGVTAWTTAERVTEIMRVKSEVDAEITAINNQRALDAAAAKATEYAEKLQALKPIWEQELIEEQAGHNRADVIATLEANIASVPAV